MSYFNNLLIIAPAAEPGTQAWADGAWATGAWASGAWEGMAGDPPLTLDIDTAGALTVSGQSLTLATSIATANGSLTIDGQTLDPLITAPQAWATGAWAAGAWAANSWVGMAGSDLDAGVDPGSLTISGQSLSITLGVAVDSGSLTISGQAHAVSLGVAIEAGALTLAGQTVDAAVSADLSVGIDAGALAIAGQSFTAALNVAVANGSLTVAGQDVTASIPVDRAWAEGAWAFGAWATDSWQGMIGPDDLAVTIDAGALSIAGQATKFAWSVPWTEGQLTLTGQTVAIDLGDEISVDIDAGELTITGQALTAATNVALTNGDLTLSGQTLDIELVGDLSVTIDAGNLTISGESISISGIEAPRDPMLGGGPTRDDRKKFKKWLEKKPYRPIDVEIEAGTLSISGQQVGVNLTDYREPFTISQDITRPLLRLPQKRKPVAVSVDIDKLIAEELRYAEELQAQKRKKRRKQDEEILLLM
jgi:hypothetical protein